MNVEVHSTLHGPVNRRFYYSKHFIGCKLNNTTRQGESELAARMAVIESQNSRHAGWTQS